MNFYPCLVKVLYDWFLCGYMCSWIHLICLEILNYIMEFEQQQQHQSGQPTPTASSRQPPPTAPPRQPPTSPTGQSAALQSQQPPSRQPATTSTSQKQESAQESVSNSATMAPKAPKQTALSRANSEASTAQSATAVEEEAMQIDSTLVENGGANPPPQEIVMEESLRMTRARMRKNRAAANR